MDLYNFQSSKERIASQAREREEKVKEKAKEAQDKYNENVKTPLEAIGGSGVEDTGLDLVKNGISRLTTEASNKLGITKDTIKSFTDKLDKIDKKELLKNPKKALQDAFQGDEDEGIQNLLKKTIQENLKKIVPKEAQDLIPNITRDIKGNAKQLSNVGDVKNIAEDSFKSLDDDIAKALPINPSTRDIQSAQLRQSMRDIRDDPRSLTLKDDLTNAQRGSSSGKIKVKVFPDDEEASSAEQAEKSAEEGIKTVQEGEKGVADTEKIVSDVKGVATKAGERALAVDTDLGGPEDPFGDIVAGIAALGTMIFGIKHKPKLPTIPKVQQISPALQLGLDQA